MNFCFPIQQVLNSLPYRLLEVLVILLRMVGSQKMWALDLNVTASTDRLFGSSASRWMFFRKQGMLRNRHISIPAEHPSPRYKSAPPFFHHSYPRNFA